MARTALVFSQRKSIESKAPVAPLIDRFKVADSMIPAGWQRLPRTPSVTVLGIVSTLLLAWLGSPDAAVAGCGDYLLPPHQIAKHQTVPPELLASGVQPLHQDRPCRGPRCQEAPRPEAPSPAPVTVVVTDHWACPQVFAWTARLEATRAVSDAPLLCCQGDRARIDRPPRG